MKNTFLEAEEYYYSILDNSSANLVMYVEPDNEETNFAKKKVESVIRLARAKKSYELLVPIE